MKNVTTRKAAFYRRFKLETKPAQNLQQLLSQAINQTKKIKERLEGVGAEANQLRCLSGMQTRDGFLCGSMVMFERGSYQTVVDDDPEATNLKVTALPPPKKAGGVQQQFVPGILYFVVYQNHVAVVQSAALRANAFEQHLAWLLRSRTGLLAPTASFVLSDEPQKVTKDRIRKSHVKAVSLGRPFMLAQATELEQAPPAKQRKTESVTRSLTPDPELLSYLRSFFKTEDSFSSLKLDDKVFQGDLEVWLEIRYPKFSRSRPEDSVRLMDNLSIALRDQDPEAVELELADGSRIKGTELKITTSVEAKVLNGVVDDTALFDELLSWISSLIRDGMVSP